jgi:peptide/nickel transport system substrate-binding protein
MLNLFVFLSLTLLVVGKDFCLGASPPTIKTGGTIRFGIPKEIDQVSLNPFQRALSINKDAGSLAFECLLTSDKSGDLMQSLVTAWEVSKDGLHYTFSLRKGVKFHNGKEMTAEDVLWSIDYARDPKNAAYGRNTLLPITSLTASDPWTIRMTLKEAYVPFLTSLTGFDTFPVVPKDSLKGGLEKLGLYPSGTGPFMMTEYRPEQRIVFKKFEHYWRKGIPYLDAIQLRPIYDATVRLTALRADDIDVMTELDYEQALRIQKGEIKDIALFFAKESGYQLVNFNTESPPFNNVKVRQAVAQALDKSEVINAISWGLGETADQNMRKSSRWHVPIEERKRDAEKARALLKEAGYPDGFKVKGQIQRSNKNKGMFQVIQNQLKEIGIEIEIGLVDFTKHQNDLRSGNFKISAHGGAVHPDPDLAYYRFYTEPGPLKNNNTARYSNPKLDRLLEQGRGAADFQKRYRIYKEAVEILHEEVPQIPLGFVPWVFAYRRQVKGFNVHPDAAYFYGSGGLGVTWLDR